MHEGRREFRKPALPPRRRTSHPNGHLIKSAIGMICLPHSEEYNRAGWDVLLGTRGPEMGTLDQFLQWPGLQLLEYLAYLATALGVPWALIIYWRDVRWQRDERDVGTYSSLDDKYLHYLELCIQHPELNMFVVPLAERIEYTPAQTVQRYALFETMISVLERAFLRYYGHKSKKWRDQWPGWEAYLRDWKAHPDFAQLWGVLGGQFDKDFIAFVDQMKAAPSSYAPIAKATIPDDSKNVQARPSPAPAS